MQKSMQDKMRNEIAVSVIIPSIGRLDSIRELLASLQQQDFDRPFEILVVANLPDWRLQTTVRAFGPSFKYVEAGRLGANIARNTGINHALGQILLFLDDDCYAHDRSFIQKHWERHQAHPNAAGCGGRYLLLEKSSPIERAYHWIADHWLTKSTLDGNHSLNLIGGNCSFKSNVFSNVLRQGFRFNESIRFGGAETDLCARLTRDGHQLLLFDDMNIEHRPSIGFRGFLDKAYLQGFSAGVRAVDFPKPVKRHWRSTLTIEQNWELAGVRPEPNLKRYFNFYDTVFEFGFDSGFDSGREQNRKQGQQPGARPPLSFSSYFLYRLKKKLNTQSVRSLLYDGFLTLDRCLASTRRLEKPRAKRH